MFVGIDTSNYTTSLAVLDDNINQEKIMLSVKQGERGLRQSDAVFQHTVNMPKLLEKVELSNIEAIGVSVRPRNVENSYMPCFLVGEAVATAISKSNNIPIFKTSHQIGHILAVLYDTDNLDLINDSFIAFHLSGGTTEALLVEPHKTELIKASIIGESSDLKAGQAIDRAGVMMGLDFPCGRELDRLSKQSNVNYKIKPSMNGFNCSLSGVENKAQQMYDKGESKKNISNFVLSYICSSVEEMLSRIIKEYGDLPIVFSGGVSSNTMLRERMNNRFNAYFARPEFSLDNAAGVAVYARIMKN